MSGENKRLCWKIFRNSCLHCVHFLVIILCLVFCKCYFYNHFKTFYIRMMYWSIVSDRSHIEESAMDGSLRRVLLEKNLRRPTGVTLDLFIIHLLAQWNFMNTTAQMYIDNNSVNCPEECFYSVLQYTFTFCFISQKCYISF